MSASSDFFDEAELEVAVLEETQPINKNELVPKNGWQAKQREGEAGKGLGLLGY